MMNFAKLGAIGFGLWGLLHIAGAGLVLSATLGSGPADGYAIYGYDGGPLPGATGAILAYFAYLLALSGAAALAVAIKLNWSNSQAGLAINSGLVLTIEFGLIVFLIVPGYLSLLESLPGFVFFAIGAIFGGIACKRDPSHA
ncbi:hypothetical protein [Roseibium album]|uniref:Uncharacterized protein n=1 Tax=Roseibium album TaxID=311410 RepID=A0A0M7AMW7_9HYPH|nr:hypothetical protein [Roseibium album]CTQ59686.1 hypothetical protein LA5094_02454 [Roseibium album]CTQ75997.1 hypothetical protein LA5095_03510 [Roseibium album]CTQ76560.1 hypothetical protein LA5096_04792 [Roseibium album]